MPKPPATRLDSLGTSVGLNDVVAFTHTRGRTKLAFGLVRDFTRKGIKVLPFTARADLQEYYHRNLLIKQPATFIALPNQEEYRGVAYIHLCQLFPDIHQKPNTDA